MNESFQEFVARYLSAIEDCLLENLPLSNQYGTQQYNEALHYAMFPGGKRFRPILTLLAGSLVAAPANPVLLIGSAIEYLHTSSMVIDDLPAMDDALLRRGKKALHLAFSESTAMLVSLGLMNHSYSLLVKACGELGNPMAASRIIPVAADAIGADGMIGGQVVDLELNGTRINDDYLFVRNLKTTSLIRLMLTAPAIAVNASESEVRALDKFGAALGMAYQIYDDVLDEVGSPEQIGKPAGQDQRHLRPSYVGEYGVAQAKKMAVNYVLEGIAGLERQFGVCREVRMFEEGASLIFNQSSRPVAKASVECFAVS